MRYFRGDSSALPVHVSVASTAGAYTVGSASFFHYIVRLAEVALPLCTDDREALDMLAAIPHAFFDEDVQSGKGWRIVPASTLDDWPVLESTPQRLRAALQTARRVLWQHASPVGVSAREIVAIEEELDKVLGVLQRAEAAGVPVSVTYVS